MLLLFSRISKTSTVWLHRLVVDISQPPNSPDLTPAQFFILTMGNLLEWGKIPWRGAHQDERHCLATCRSFEHLRWPQSQILERCMKRIAAKDVTLEGKYNNYFLVSRGDLSVLIGRVPELYCLALERWREECLEHSYQKWRKRLKCKTVKSWYISQFVKHCEEKLTKLYWNIQHLRYKLHNMNDGNVCALRKKSATCRITWYWKAIIVYMLKHGSPTRGPPSRTMRPVATIVNCVYITYLLHGAESFLRS